jgi:hypothetical protein
LRGLAMKMVRESLSGTDSPELPVKCKMGIEEV